MTPSKRRATSNSSTGSRTVADAPFLLVERVGLALLGRPKGSSRLAEDVIRICSEWDEQQIRSMTPAELEHKIEAMRALNKFGRRHDQIHGGR